MDKRCLFIFFREVARRSNGSWVTRKHRICLKERRMDNWRRSDNSRSCGGFNFHGKKNDNFLKSRLILVKQDSKGAILAH